jgi:plastocyanin domain-containing protein
MTGGDLLVVGAGAAAVGLLNWWFFLAGRTERAATAGGDGVQEVTITVSGGYDPETVRVRAGRTVRLVLDRRETDPCSEELVLPAFGVRKFLPAHERTTIDFTPATPGTYEFTCGMGMLHGRVVVEG